MQSINIAKQNHHLKFHHLQAKKEAAEAEKARMEIGMSSSGDLAAMIAVHQRKRETEMNNFLAGLEEKYSSKNTKKRKTTKSKK